MSNVEDPLSDVLFELGDFGKYQFVIVTLLAINVIFHTFPLNAFVFVSKNIEYRCKISECDAADSEYESHWLMNAVPYINDMPHTCEKYKFLNMTKDTRNITCDANRFDNSTLVHCDEFVYKTQERNILNDFSLHCDANLWKLTLAGTVNNIGQFIGSPIEGIFSDKFGTKVLLIAGMVACGITGIVKAFSTNFEMFLALEFLGALFLSGTYSCCFILGVELVNPKKRVLIGTIMCYSFAIGEIIVASIAWFVQSWRPLLIILHSPLLITIAYIWMVPKSVRWLLSQGRHKEAQNVLLKIGRFNNKEISEEALKKLKDRMEDKPTESFYGILKSRILILRLINGCFCWITCNFLFYGLTLYSVTLHGNSYLDFILTALIEIPAYALTNIAVDKIGRRPSQVGSFFITAISCFMFIFVRSEQYILSLCLYLLGKFGASAAYTIAYIISSEIFPTPFRNSLMGICSMVGRFGSMVAPQMPLLNTFWTPLPLLLFSGMAFISGLLSLMIPETLNLDLPDTIEDAENIGRIKQESST